MTARPVMLVAGEISGDMHAARLVRELRARRPDLAFFGIGGPALRQAGMETVADINEMAVLGVSEVLWKYFFFRNVFNRVLRLARERRPQAVILVDYPGFNLRLAKRLRAMGLKVLYYVCPQVWAWNRGRIPRMARDVDRLMAIFPFEKEVFSGSRLRVDFVGHPLRESADETLAEQAPDLPWQGSPRLAILPGSRRHEIRRILPPLWAAAGILARRNPGLGVIVATPSDDISRDVRRRIDQRVAFAAAHIQRHPGQGLRAAEALSDACETQKRTVVIRVHKVILPRAILSSSGSIHPRSRL